MNFFKRKKNIAKPKKEIAKSNFDCPKNWDELKGTKQVKFCKDCNNNVYDLRGLTEEETIQFIKANDGEVCALAHYNTEGRVVNGECNETTLTISSLGAIAVVEVSELEKVDRKLKKMTRRLQDLDELKKLIENKKS